MKKWTFFMLLIAVLLFGSVIGFNLFKQQKIAEYLANRPEPEFPVTAVDVEAVDWVPVIERSVLSNLTKVSRLPMKLAA